MEAVDPPGDALDGEVFLACAAKPNVDIPVVVANSGGDFGDGDALFSCRLKEDEDLSAHFAAFDPRLGSAGEAKRNGAAHCVGRELEGPFKHIASWGEFLDLWMFFEGGMEPRVDVDGFDSELPGQQAGVDPGGACGLEGPHDQAS